MPAVYVAACCYLYEHRSAMSDLGHIISFTFSIDDLNEAKDLADRLTAALVDDFPELQPEATTVAHEGNPYKSHWIYCGRLLPGRKRCMLPTNHAGVHLADWPVA